MRVSSVFSLLVCLGLGVASVASAETYKSEDIGSVTGRQYLKLNNNMYALTMRQDAPGLNNENIVIENRNPGYYSEYRPGTLPGTTRAIATDMNDSQSFVGYAQTLDGNGASAAPERAFLHSNGVFTDLGALIAVSHPDAQASRALSINNVGDVLGYWRNSSATHWFIYSHGVFTELGTLSPTTTVTPGAINDARQLTGSHTLQATSTRPGWSHAFLYSQGTLVDLNADNNGLGSAGKFINARGDVAGYAKPATHSQTCFVYSDGVLSVFALRVSSIGSCSVNALNNSGSAVGQSSNNGAPPSHLTDAAFLYTNGQVIDLNTLIDPSDNLAVNHIGLSGAFAINDAGYIIARGGTKNYLLKPQSATQPTDGTVYNFEYTTHGWNSEGDAPVSLYSSTGQKFAGIASLAVQFSGSGFTSVGVLQPPSLAGKTATFHLYLPPDAPIEWVQPFALEGESGNWAWHGNWQSTSGLQKGVWNTLTVNVPPNAHAIWRLGVELYTSQPYSGAVYIDSIDF